jgi:hypothetical protein
LSVIPEVRTDVCVPNGGPEGFLMARTGREPATLPIGANRELVSYLKRNSGYHVAQHGCYHDYQEFGLKDPQEIDRRLVHGARRLQEAGFGRPRAFVAPHDRLSRNSMAAVGGRFDVVSTCWFNINEMPVTWWPFYMLSIVRNHEHWRVGQSRLLSHPGCLLSYRRPMDTMFQSIRELVESQPVTVLVTHWWEYFLNSETDAAFIQVLHQTAEYLAKSPDVRVVSFADVAEGRVPLN